MMNEKYDDYLKDVIFLGRNSTGILNEELANNLKKTIMEKSFKSFTEKNDYFTMAYDKISKVLPTNNKIDNNWKDCVKGCYTICHEYVKNEMESTAYMLRILSASVLGDTKNYKIGFYINDDVFNYPNIIGGKWNDDTKEPDKNSPDKNIIQDKDLFQIEICKVSIVDGKTTIINYTKPNGRFILGAGPSASGKTYNAGLMIQMMKMVDPSFPDFFMTIDGGTYREKSVIYQTIVDAVKNKKQYPGLKNLMSASVLDKFRGVQSIFETDSIKKVINDYLLEQTKKEKFISLYVPDTLTYCGIPTDCRPKLEKYIQITGDNNWVGLMIYQHKNGGEGCPFQKKYKCVGCTESGKTREITEGKKYSSGAWKMSYDHGLQTIKQAPNYRIVFHNGGKRETPSIFEDLSKEKIPYDTIQDFFTKNNIVYIDGELIKNDKCDDYLLKDCKIHKNVKPDPHVVRIDGEFVNKYKNKYIGIPTKLIDILNSNHFDNMDDETAALLVMIQKFIKSGFFALSDMDLTKMDKTEVDYKYYHINMDKFNYDRDYEDFKTLVESDDIKIYEKETTPPSVFNFFSMPSVSNDETKKDDIEINIERNPVVINTFTPDEIINTLSKNRYIGIPKEVMSRNEDDKNYKRETLEHLINEKIITKIDINEKFLDEKTDYGINEKMYDYYKINIDEYIDLQIKNSIDMIKAEIRASFDIISDKNTLYIYENQAEPKGNETIGDAANNQTTKSLVNTAGNHVWNFVSRISENITGNKPKDEETKEEQEEENGDKSNDKPPKCKKNNTTKKNVKGNKAKSKKK